MYEGVNHTEAHLFKKSAIVPRLQNIMLYQDLVAQTSETCSNLLFSYPGF